MVFRQIVLHALLVGFISGVLLTAMQFYEVIPIIQEAEQFENSGTAPSAGEYAHHGQAHAAHEHDHETTGTGKRTALTLFANALTGAAFGLIVLAAMAASTLYSNELSMPSWSHGLFWGGVGYAIFFVAPAIGQPPQIPGAERVPLEASQMWWAMTVVFSAAGVAGVLFGKTPWRWAFLGLPAIPYTVGPPDTLQAAFAHYPASVAAELEVLAQEFIVATAITNAALWLMLGFGSVWALRRIYFPSDSDQLSQTEHRT